MICYSVLFALLLDSLASLLFSLITNALLLDSLLLDSYEVEGVEDE